MRALVSIHDVMPHTMDRVERILQWLHDRGLPPVTLLVVPGHPWSERQIERLRELAEQGHQLAAHGWDHKTTPRKLYHRIHATLISRNVAEHLDLGSAGVLQLMIRSRDWFGTHDLPMPNFYVPPAWALGPISRADLCKVPFELIETTRGLIHLRHAGSPAPRTQRDSNSVREETEAIRETRPHFQKLPLTGYEADTPSREFFLRIWNAAQFAHARSKALPLRISIHPDDLDLRVADQMDRQVRSITTFCLYCSFLSST
jgi:predicted deacetylase